MAVLVSKKGGKRYQIAGGIGLSQADREQADRLDSQLEKKIAELVEDLAKRGLLPSEKGRGSLQAYWELGRVLRSAANSRDFPHKAELPLLWQNAKIYVPESLLYSDRGPYREHLWYCYRLGSYTEILVGKMNWGEWVTLFDSSGINQEARFDAWFQQKLDGLRFRLDREWVRMFTSCVNEMLGNIDIAELKDKELFNCYEAAWEIVSKWLTVKKGVSGCTFGRIEIQHAINQNLAMLDQIMEGRVAPEEFAEYIIEILLK